MCSAHRCVQSLALKCGTADGANPQPMSDLLSHGQGGGDTLAASCILSAVSAYAGIIGLPAIYH